MQTKDTNISRKILPGVDQLYYDPYYCFVFSKGGTEFQIGIARGHKAGGLIGTEMNGIFILDDTRKQVIVDRHLQREGCWPPGQTSPRLEEEVDRIIGMSESELSHFFETSERARSNPLTLKSREAKCRSMDKGLRNSISESDFEGESEFWPAKECLKVVRQWELFLLALLEGDRDLMTKRFSKSLYRYFSLKTGHIAHYDRRGFLAERFAAPRGRELTLSLLKEMKSPLGGKLQGPLNLAISKITEQYVR